jgi:hypothetical protein
VLKIPDFRGDRIHDVFFIHASLGAVVGEVHVIPARHGDRLRAIDEWIVGQGIDRLRHGCGDVAEVVVGVVVIFSISLS